MSVPPFHQLLEEVRADGNRWPMASIAEAQLPLNQEGQQRHLFSSTRGGSVKCCVPLNVPETM